ncbi:MAG: glycosyltransferase [Clostridia bacterium]|nr:glycosyltransferase [Clostridia bacterium]
MPDITVVIPVYNVAGYLPKCVDSVLAQTYSDYAVILVDDGSTDTSGSICDEYAEKYANIRVIHQQNKGLGGARNTGIEACETPYIFFLDSDDYLHPETLKICMDLAKPQDCDMVFFDAVAVDEQGNLGARYDLPLPDSLFTPKTVPAVLFLSGAWNRIYKTDLFIKNDIRFPEKVWYEDLKTVPKLSVHAKNIRYYREKPLYYYLQRSGSIMHTPDFNRLVTERIAAIDDVWQYFRDRDLWTAYRTELEYMRIFHGFFLPVREMQAASNTFPPFADRLREDLMRYCPDPMSNPYLATLSGKERKMLSLFVERHYGMVKLFSAMNKWVKGVKNVFKK